jgi:uncharacterized integral membrane protein (TIGR00697 family)
VYTRAMQFKTKYYFFIAVAFVALLLISNTVAVKIIALGPFTLAGSILIFPFTYILGDILTEVYGYRGARPIIWTGFVLLFFMALIYTLVRLLPSAPFWDHNDAFTTILGQAPRIVVASLLGYAMGSFSNSLVLSRMKVWMRGKYLWIRTIGSTIIGEALDSIIFVTVAFAGRLPDHGLVALIVSSYLVKVAIEVIVTPITYKAVRFLKTREQIDTYDQGISYNPFRS